MLGRSSAVVRRELRYMTHWLRENFPNDVLMPVDKGAKHPKYCHRSGEWTWDRYHAEKLSMEDMDVCILLRELCAVDVDSDEQALQLEERFPILKNAPMERTARGRHYWFIRPDVADTMGYFDGAGQRERGIDFKSVCATGTSGIILVAPSTNKSWIRSPWNTENLTEMPLEVLDAIAVPTRVHHDMVLHFVPSNERMHYVGCGILDKLSYFEPFLSGDLDSTTAVVPLPCTGTDFELMIQVLTDVYIGCPPSPALLQSLRRTVDLLGLDTRVARRMLTRGKLIDWHDIYRMSGDMWRACSAEAHAMTSGESSSIVVRVDEALARLLKYEPIDKQDDIIAWLFPKADRVQADPGTPVLYPNPEMYLCGSIHPLVFQILTRFPGHVVLAGGSVVGAVASLVESWQDYDLFFYDCTPAEADKILREIIAMAKPKVTHQSAAATTMFLQDGTMVQVIHTLYQTSADVIMTFDMAPCKMLARIDDMGTLVVEAMPTCCESLRRMAFMVDYDKWSTSSVSRTLKYVSRGFEVMLPGVRRAALRTNSRSPFGVAKLLEFEELIERRRIFNPRHLADVRDRLSMSEVKDVLPDMYPSSDYSEMSRLTGRLMYVLQSMVGRMCGRRRAPVQDQSTPWLMCDIAGKKNCNRNPSDPGLRNLHDLAELMRINDGIVPSS